MRSLPNELSDVESSDDDNVNDYHVDDDNNNINNNNLNVNEEGAASSSSNLSIHAITAAASSATKESSFSPSLAQHNQIVSDEICTPIGECELCPSKWKVLIEKEEPKMKGEYESCFEYGRRIQFECTVLFQGEFISWFVCCTSVEDTRASQLAVAH